MSSAEQGVLTLGRTCGECVACCTTHDVSSIKKARGQQCAHVSKGGCSVYSTRPGECAGYECWWLSGNGNEALWPYHCGFVVSLVEATVVGNVFVMCEAQLGSLETPLARVFTETKLAVPGVAVAHIFLSGKCVVYLTKLNGLDESIRKKITEKEHIEFLPNIKGEVL